jgi:hypothetical protein
MKTQITLVFLLSLITITAKADSPELFKTIFLDNSTVKLEHPENKDFTLGTYFAATMYMDTHFQAPTFECSMEGANKECFVLWLSGNYEALNETEAAKVPKEITSRGAPFLQTTDCGRSLKVTLSKSSSFKKVIRAEMIHEACGGYGGDF